MTDKPDMEKIVALCKRRGFIFQSSEIYGGIGGFWDYGPLGCELKRNIKDAWWLDMVRNPPLGPNNREFQMVGVDCSIIMNPKVWEASGHVGGFSDPMVDCKECKARFREDFVVRLELFEQSELPEQVDLFHLHRSLEGQQAYKVAYTELGLHMEDWVPAIKLALNVKKGKLHVVPDGSGSVAYFETGHRYYYVRQLAAGHAATGQLCPKCRGELTEPRAFNLMFETHTGALQDSSSKVYLRPETAQGIFVNFKNVMDSSRVKIPFGIAQIGKAFRNEINPRNYTFRSREFEQMEIEFFCHESESMAWWEFWRDVRINWYKQLGLTGDKLRPRNQTDEELAHYSKACTDIEYLFPFSDEPQELEGVAHRGSFDLEAHGQASKGKKDAFAVIDDELQSRHREGAESAPATRFVPHVIEPSAGADRATLAFICDAYRFDASRASPEFLCLHPRLAPIKAAVFPLVAKDGMPELAEPIYREIRKHFPCQFDAKQSIGKRYARMDEAGTPFCFTIDGQTREDGTVTVRNRDNASQERIDKSRCLEYLTVHL